MAALPRQEVNAKLFWRHVEISDGCWLWKGGVDRCGYGRFRHRGALWQAHRFSWCIAGNVLPSRLILRHRCDTPACVRPDHLVLGTKADNSNDMVERGRSLTGDRNPRRRMPEKYPRAMRARLNPQDAAEIRRRYKERNVTQDVLAKAYGVNYRTIGRIVRGETWR